MFEAIRRVISDSEDVGKSHKKAKTTMNSTEPSPMEGVQTTTGLLAASSPGSHLVEPDHHSVGIAAPLKMVHSSGQSDHYASNSSLSDGSDPGSRDGEEDALVPAITHPPPKPETKEKIVPQTLQRVAVLNRMDSAADGSSSGSQRASSQNSSRDWGWFEDVHQASDGLNSNEKRDMKKMMPPSRAPDMTAPENSHGMYHICFCGTIVRRIASLFSHNFSVFFCYFNQ